MSFHQGKHLSKNRHRVSLVEMTNQISLPLEEKKKITKLGRNSSIEGLSKKQTIKHSQLTKMVGLAFSKRHQRRSFKSQKQNRVSTSSISDASVSLTSNTSISPLSPKSPHSPKLTFKSNFFKEGKELLSSKMSEMKMLEEELQVIIDQPIKTHRIALYRERFKFIQKLGQGSYSQVFLVQERTTKAIFALKVIKKEQLQDPNELKRFISELKIQLFCDHPNIVKSYGTFWDQDNVYILQEYPGKESLYSLIQKKKHCLQVEEVSELIGQLCQAVGYLHSYDIIHRDLKPENILIGPGNVVKLTDFGWSVHNPQKKLRNTFCGTPFYFSPELLSAQSYDESVDIWTIGVMTYEMLTGENPFGIKRFEDLKRIVSQEANFGKIENWHARDFVSKLIKKERLLRTSAKQILEHSFLHLGKAG